MFNEQDHQISLNCKEEKYMQQCNLLKINIKAVHIKRKSSVIIKV